MTYMEETAGIIEKRTQLNLSSSMVVTFHIHHYHTSY